MLVFQQIQEKKWFYSPLTLYLKLTLQAEEGTNTFGFIFIISPSYQPQRKEVTSFYWARCSHYIQDLLVCMFSG